MNYLTAILVTILIEFFVYFIFFRKDYLKLFLFSALINLITNPLANLLDVYLASLIIEGLVIIAEVYLIKYLFNCSCKKAVIVSLVANIASFFIGTFISFFIPF